MSGALAGRAASAWAVAGVCLLFASAVFRLGERGLRTIANGLGPGEWLLLAALTVAMVWGEGVVALERRWVPRVLERARDLAAERNPVLMAFAPLYGLSLIAAPRARMVRAWASILAIIAAVTVVRTLPEPWRGMIDFSVAAALAWGLLSIVRGAPAALRRPERGSELPRSRT